MSPSRSPLLAGTLDLLILKTLSASEMHGYAIGQHIRRLSKDALRVEEGSLYPALQRAQVKGWIASDAKRTPTGRRARYYRITAKGRRQLAAEEKDFHASVAATTLVLEGDAS
ncbi:MAG: PadR family transcriptional regulator [Gemmatimonadaceae bacterium]